VWYLTSRTSFKLSQAFVIKTAFTLGDPCLVVNTGCNTRCYNWASLTCICVVMRVRVNWYVDAALIVYWVPVTAYHRWINNIGEFQLRSCRQIYTDLRVVAIVDGLQTANCGPLCKAFRFQGTEGRCSSRMVLSFILVFEEILVIRNWKILVNSSSTQQCRFFDCRVSFLLNMPFAAKSRL